jgi:hypothetical protein
MHFSKEEKAMRLEDWRLSGKSAWAYAKENNLVPQTFLKWTKNETSLVKPCFVQVQSHSMPPLRHTQEILIEKGELKIHIPLFLSSGELQAVMRGLEVVL